ncbi:MATE efflux family protein 1 [Platanthera guangdongensis]|uniref:Protein DETOXIFICATION n=1 Tax=Platanthera guangdongensis TaxID=2320717 RepID=A0ABR2LKV2_9ASPA
MKNTHDASNNVASCHDPLEETRNMSQTPVNGSGTAATTTDDSVESAPIISSSRTPRKTGIHLFFQDICCVFKLDDLGREIARIAIPAALALAADPLASLVDTAFIGQLGSVELAAVGVSIAIFNQVSKIAIYPLVSITTSFVAEEDALCSNILEGKENLDLEKPSTVTYETKESYPSDEDSYPGKIRFNLPNIFSKWANLSTTRNKRKCIPSVSTALVVGAVLGILQTILLIVTAKSVLHIMGVKLGSPMLRPAMRYLILRSLGSPAVLLSLSMQGVFRGFKDTRTPLYASVAGDLINIILDPILIFVFHMGVSGAAISHVISQYLISLILLFRLIKKVDVVPHSIKSLKFARFLRCGFLLLARVIAVTFCVTLAASLAAHHGPTPMAAFQICLQIWLSTSLLADGLAVAGQAILASAFAKGDLQKVEAATSRVLQLSIVLGLALSALLGVGLEFGSGIFTKDINVIKYVHKAIPFVAGTQTINSLAFVLDGVNFGASDYTFSAYSMVAVAAVSIPSLIFLSISHGFVGIWIALTIYMSLRTVASVWRMASATGPWSFIVCK